MAEATTAAAKTGSTRAKKGAAAATGNNGAAATPAPNGNGAETGGQTPPPAAGFETARSIVLVPLEQVRPHPHNTFRQHTAESREELKQIVEADKGTEMGHRRLMDYPLNLVPATKTKEDGSQVLLKKDSKQIYWPTNGNQRFDVYKELGLTHVPALLHEQMDASEQVFALVNANRNRPLTALEIGLAYLELVEAAGGERGRGRGAKSKGGTTQADFAARIGKSQGYVSDAVKAAKTFLAFPKPLQDQIKKANAEGEVVTREHLGLLASQIGDVPTRERFAKGILQHRMSASTLEAAIGIFTGKQQPADAVSSIFGKFLKPPAGKGAAAPAATSSGAAAATPVSGGAAAGATAAPTPEDAIDQALANTSSTAAPPAEAEVHVSSEEARKQFMAFWNDTVLDSYTSLLTFIGEKGPQYLNDEDRQEIAGSIQTWMEAENSRWGEISKGNYAAAGTGETEDETEDEDTDEETGPAEDETEDEEGDDDTETEDDEEGDDEGETPDEE